MRDPSRVDYAVAPATWSARHGLVADHAYWVSGLRLRDDTARDATGTARGSITARSHASGEGDPAARRLMSVRVGLRPATIDGTGWGRIPRGAPRNELELTLRNLREVRIDGARTRLAGDAPLTLRIASDGPARVRLSLALPSRTVATRADGAAAPEVAATRTGAVLAISAGAVTYVLTPPERRHDIQGRGRLKTAREA